MKFCDTFVKIEPKLSKGDHTTVGRLLTHNSLETRLYDIVKCMLREAQHCLWNYSIFICHKVTWLWIYLVTVSPGWYVWCSLCDFNVPWVWIPSGCILKLARWETTICGGSRYMFSLVSLPVPCIWGLQSWVHRLWSLQHNKIQCLNKFKSSLIMPIS